MSAPHPHAELLERAQRFHEGRLSRDLWTADGLVAELVSALERQNEGETCHACGNKYGDHYWIEDEAVWQRISPKPEKPGKGLLCPHCATNRLARALTESLERERKAVAAVAMSDADNPTVQVLTEQVETLRRAANEGWAEAKKYADAWAAATRREEALRDWAGTDDPDLDRPVTQWDLGYFAAMKHVREALTTTPDAEATHAE